MAGVGGQAEFRSLRRRLRGIRPAVLTSFGGTRGSSQHPHHDRRRSVDRPQLSDAEASQVISGGGPGLMEAANRGAHRDALPAIGAPTSMLHAAKSQAAIISDIGGINFRYFRPQDDVRACFASAYVVLPAASARWNRRRKCLTPAVQTGRAAAFPNLLIWSGAPFWEGLRSVRLPTSWSGEDMIGKRTSVWFASSLTQSRRDRRAIFPFLPQSPGQPHARGTGEKLNGASG